VETDIYRIGRKLKKYVEKVYKKRLENYENK